MEDSAGNSTLVTALTPNSTGRLVKVTVRLNNPRSTLPRLRPMIMLSTLAHKNSRKPITE